MLVAQTRQEANTTKSAPARTATEEVSAYGSSHQLDVSKTLARFVNSPGQMIELFATSDVCWGHTDLTPEFSIHTSPPTVMRWAQSFPVFSVAHDRINSS